RDASLATDVLLFSTGRSAQRLDKPRRRSAGQRQARPAAYAIVNRHDHRIVIAGVKLDGRRNDTFAPADLIEARLNACNGFSRKRPKRTANQVRYRCAEFGGA